MGPAGTVHCSVPDWAKFAALHLAGEPWKGSKLLKPATFRTLHTPPPGREYAGGWIVVERSWAGGVALNHNGSNTSWYVDDLAGAGAELRRPRRDQPGDKHAETACDAAASALINELPALTRLATPALNQRGHPPDNVSSRWHPCHRLTAFQVDVAPDRTAADRVGRATRRPGSGPNSPRTGGRARRNRC